MNNRDRKTILRACLKKLSGSQYQELVNDLIPAKNQDDFTNKENKSETLSDFERWDMFDQLETALREKWPDLLEKELSKLSQRNTAPKKTDIYASVTEKINNRIPFTNRENEIRQLMDEFAPAYYLVDAPAGYGKTALLEALEIRFTNEKRICGRVSFQDNDKAEGIADAFAKSFDLEIPKNHVQHYLQASLLGNALYEKFKNLIQNDKFGKGVVLLIDLDKKPSISFVRELLQVIADVRRHLKRLSFFEYGQNRFRVILAGRNIATQSEIRNSEFPFSVLRLSPFSYSVIQEAVRNHYSSDEAEWSVKDLSAHLFYMTGGHPGCIINILNRNDLQVVSGQLPYEQDEQIWKDVVREEFLDIRDGLKKSSHELDVLSGEFGILRILDYFILRRMREHYKDQIQKDEYQLADLLTSTYLLDWKGRVLRDDIARRLLAIGIRHENEDFSSRCMDARKLCAERLKQPDTHMPERWFIEYLFQSLQLHGKEIFDRDQRRKIREEFFNVDVLDAWKILANYYVVNPDEVIAEKSAFDQAFDEDWEFRFTINYYLREDRYDDSEDQPYNKLRNKIDDFFKGMHQPRPTDIMSS